MKPLPFYLLEPVDRIAIGDLYLHVQRGNVIVAAQCHPSWKGTLVADCPEGIYLRRRPGAAVPPKTRQGNEFVKTGPQ